MGYHDVEINRAERVSRYDCISVTQTLSQFNSFQSEQKTKEYAYIQWLYTENMYSQYCTWYRQLVSTSSRDTLGLKRDRNVTYHSTQQG
jgi:hypothetical protein